MISRRNGIVVIHPLAKEPWNKRVSGFHVYLAGMQASCSVVRSMENTPPKKVRFPLDIAHVSKR